MVKRFLAFSALLLAAIALSGCVETGNGPIVPPGNGTTPPGNGTVVPPGDEATDFVRNYPLEANWTVREAETGSYGGFFSNRPGNTDTIVFENDEIICKQSVMPGVEPRAEFAFAFFAKGTAPKVFTRGLQPFRVFVFQDKTLLVFTRCGDAYGQTPPFIAEIFAGLAETGTEMSHVEWRES